MTGDAGRGSLLPSPVSPGLPGPGTLHPPVPSPQPPPPPLGSSGSSLGPLQAGRGARESGAYLGSAGRPSVHAGAREVVGRAEGTRRAVPGGPVSEQRPPPLGQGDSGFRRPGGRGGRGGTGAATSAEAHSEGGGRAWPGKNPGLLRGPPAQSVPPDAGGPACSLRGPLPLQSFSLFPALTSCKPPAETLPSSGPARGPASAKGRAVSTEGPPTPYSRVCCPRTRPSNATSPKVDQIPWDPLLTTERPPPATGVPGQRRPAYPGPLDEGIPLTGPPPPA